MTDSEISVRPHPGPLLVGNFGWGADKVGTVGRATEPYFSRRPSKL